MELYVITGGCLTVLAFLYWQYCSLIIKKNRVKEAWSAIDVQLKKRFDLIPNLVATVTAHENYEKDVLTQIVQLRSNIEDKATNSALDDKTIRFANENCLSTLIPQLLAKVENYPDLKVNSSFLDLQKSLKDVEGHIAAARRFYNSAVNDYNNAVNIFPSSLIAKQMGFKNIEYFVLNEK